MTILLSAPEVARNKCLQDKVAEWLDKDVIKVDPCIPVTVQLVTLESCTVQRHYSHEFKQREERLGVFAAHYGVSS